MADDIYSQMPVLTWEVGSYFVAAKARVLDEQGGNRIVRRARPYRDGAKLDDTGSVEKVWQVEFFFYNGGSEPGIANDIQYPDNLDLMIESFDEHETGTLTLPTRGPVRCRAETYRRTESSDARDAATLAVTFVQDNEDGVGADSFSAPSARSVARSQIEEAVFSAEDAGLNLPDMDDLSEFAAEIEGLLNSPAEFLSDIEQQAARTSAALDRVENAVEAAPSQTSAGAVRALSRARDTVARANSLAARVTVKTFQTPRTLVSISSEVGVSVAELLKVNPNISNPLNVPANTPIKVPSG